MFVTISDGDWRSGVALPVFKKASTGGSPQVQFSHTDFRYMGRRWTRRDILQSVHESLKLPWGMACNSSHVPGQPL